MKELWTTKYRPTLITEYVFRDEAQKAQVKSWLNDGTVPHLLFSGSAGTGKTTLAKVLLNELGVDEGDIRKIWGHRFKMVKCEVCGCPIMPEKQLEFEAARAELDPSYFTTCPACSQQQTVTTIRTAFDLKSIASGDAAEMAC